MGSRPVDDILADLLALEEVCLEPVVVVVSLAKRMQA
jgi:hypothetical protein